MLPPSDLYIVDDRDDGGTIRLKFTTVVWNAGDGPMEMRGCPPTRCTTVATGW